MSGKVFWSPGKSLWISGMYLGGVLGIASAFSREAFLLFLFSTGLTILGGHSLGMHRRLIHNSFECPLWLEYFLVYLGVLVGMAGPFGMIRTHDMRDWAQRQRQCHDYFAHRRSFFTDWFWQLHCSVRLEYEPEFQPETRIAQDRFYWFLERTWMWQQLPWASVLFYFGGISWVLWGICLRVAIINTGHWLIGHFAHNEGQRYWHVEGAAVQGYNIPFCGLITMGECWHNNHHAFPGSARLGLYRNQLDPGWYTLRVFEWFGLAWNLQQPGDLPHRAELKAIAEPKPCCIKALLKLA
ncbi:MAG TPA: acyl-CoA desaturase [Gammaproteobacteria bacterium]|nr:acyl-CoA desaturase [Gammaproteobacteria bacterium]